MKDEHHSFDDLAEAQNSEDGGSGDPRPRRGGHRGEPRRRRGGFFRSLLPVLLVLAVIGALAVGGVVRSVVAAAAGRDGQGHGQRQNQCKKLLHGIAISLFMLPRSRGGFL